MTVSEQYLVALLVNISFLNHYMLIFSLFALLHSFWKKKKKEKKTLVASMVAVLVVL